MPCHNREYNINIVRHKVNQRVNTTSMYFVRTADNKTRAVHEYIFLDQVRLRTEVLRTPNSTRTVFELMASRSWQYISCLWDACSNHLAISDIKIMTVHFMSLRRLLLKDWTCGLIFPSHRVHTGTLHRLNLQGALWMIYKLDVWSISALVGWKAYFIVWRIDVN